MSGLSESAGDIAAKADAYGATVRRCDAMAPPPVHDSAEFRRLVDGIGASLASLQKAIAAHDTEAQRRALSELRSLGDTLTLRYG
jgi:hypothetical protein